MKWTDDPVKDAERYFEEQEEKLKMLPTCCECGEHIQQEDAVYINDEWICDDCLSSYRREVVQEW